MFFFNRRSLRGGDSDHRLRSTFISDFFFLSELKKINKEIEESGRWKHAYLGDKIDLKKKKKNKEPEALKLRFLRQENQRERERERERLLL